MSQRSYSFVSDYSFNLTIYFPQKRKVKILRLRIWLFTQMSITIKRGKLNKIYRKFNVKKTLFYGRYRLNKHAFS